MTRRIYFVTLLLAVLFVGCKNGKKEKEVPVIDIQPVKHLPEIKEVWGVIGEGTSMDVIEVVTDAADTLQIMNPAQVLTGGLIIGDRINIIYTAKGDTLIGNMAVNVTELTHLWSQLDDYGNEQSIELTPEGEVYTVNMGKINYDSWRLDSGSLLLHSPAANDMAEYTDTFSISLLTEKQLVLSARGMDTAFER